MLSIAIGALFAASCSRTETAESTHHNFVLVGSTACDAAIKSALTIAADTKCDFIRWNLMLGQTRRKTCTLDLNYGEGQPNTSGFIGGGKRIAATGTFDVTSGPAEREIYRLKSTRPGIDVSLVKLNANLFHVIGPDGAMMIGNGGWSYTLNRNPAVPNAASSVVAPQDSPVQPLVIFDGRTPCREISELAGIPFGADCFKLKWKAHAEPRRGQAAYDLHHRVDVFP